MKMIKQKVIIDARQQEVYEAYTDAKKHGEITGSKVVYENKVGGKFSAWDGELEGGNLELVDGKKIVQRWRADDWPEGHYSTLTIELFPDPSPSVILGSETTPESFNSVWDKSDSGQAGMTKVGTWLVLTQENVPDDKFDDINTGWHEYYWEPMREYFKQ